MASMGFHIKFGDHHGGGIWPKFGSTKLLEIVLGIVALCTSRVARGAEFAPVAPEVADATCPGAAETAEVEDVAVAPVAPVVGSPRKFPMLKLISS